jgi:hypothetical protein
VVKTSNISRTLLETAAKPMPASITAGPTTRAART